MSNKDLKSSLLFYKFLLENGFEQGKCNGILELIQDVPNSISKYLTEKQNQLLLSKKVNYPDLEKYDIYGARGYLDSENGIIIPKTSETKNYFKTHFPLINYFNYEYPNTICFDTVLAFHTWDLNDLTDEMKQFISPIYYSFENYYIGFITNKDDKTINSKLNLYYSLLDSINNKNRNKHILVEKKAEDKELYLIRKR